MGHRCSYTLTMRRTGRWSGLPASRMMFPIMPCVFLAAVHKKPCLTVVNCSSVTNLICSELGAGGWSPLDTDHYQWLQVDLGSRKEIVAIATQGRYSSSDWTRKYQLIYSDTPKNWRPYLQDGNIWVSRNLLMASDVPSEPLTSGIHPDVVRHRSHPPLQPQQQHFQFFLL